MALTLSPLLAGAQTMRLFPRHALRGEIAFASYPELLLNGQAARLSPGARVRDALNMQPMHGDLVGKKFIVNFTLTSMGMVQDVWILTPAEIAKQPWPRTPQEAQTWGFDQAAQVWVKP
ncbi:MAG: hypothetical protein IV094_15585 [Vitreoscilla sp.]|nr:hypothetical protein [Vitreoscilla sp.]